MDYIKYIILGIVQGITEPLPVSSSGHIYLFKNLFNTEIFNTFNFEIISNFGSFLAILFIFRKDIIKLIKDFFTYIFSKEKRNSSKNGFMYVIKMIISTIPVGISGILFNDYLESNYTSLKMLAFAFMFTALMLYIVRNIKGEKNSYNITFKDAIIIGLFQAITIIPGISRSGDTIGGGMTRNFTRETAFKFSFILYIPISVATMILGVKDLIESSLSLELWIGYIASAITAGVFTYVATKWFKKIVEKGNLIYFVWYCLIVGTLVILFL